MDNKINHKLRLRNEEYSPGATDRAVKQLEGENYNKYDPRCPIGDPMKYDVYKPI